MNQDNSCHLEGHVSGDCWTRYRSQPGGQRGQVRFWLVVARMESPAYPDQLLCAIEPKTVEELEHFTREIRSGRRLSMSGHARSLNAGIQLEDRAVVVFVAESCGFDGAAAAAVHHRIRVVGKMAAAGEAAQPELLEGPK